MRRPALVALVGAVGVLSGCVRGKGEAASLVAAVDRYRKADLLAKAPLADAIDAVPCSQEDVCAAKRACMAVARPTVRGAALKAEVESALDALHDGKLTQEQAAAEDLPAKLDEASRDLEEGRAKLPACDLAITGLRFRYLR